MNTESLKTNRLPKTTEQMERVQNIWIKEWKYKAVECFET